MNVEIHNPALVKRVNAIPTMVTIVRPLMNADEHG